MADGETWFSYKLTSGTQWSANVRFTDWDNRIRVDFATTSTAILQRDAAVQTTLATNSAAGSTVNQWYDVCVRTSGARVEVWRGKRGEALAKIAETHAATELGGNTFYLSASAGQEFRFDNLRIVKAKATSDSFTDNFSDNNYTANPAWTVTGTWSAASGAMANTSAVGTSTAYRAVTSGDLQVKASLRKTSSGGTANFFIRGGASADSVYVETADGTVRIKQIVGGVTTTLDTVNLTTTLNTWYDYHIIADGKRVEVWRGPQGGTTELILETDACTVPASTRFALHAWTCTAGFDNVQFITNDPATQTMNYNGANELTSSVVGAITTTYTYDQHGRTISKADGTHTATYYWRFGDKLKQYDTTFPGESSVAFQYDGLGKRRLKLQLPSGGYTDADFTWYRWDAAGEVNGAYSAGGNLASEWDVGQMISFRIMRLATAVGNPPSTAHYAYNLKDHIGSTVAQYDGTQKKIGASGFTASGKPTLATGVPFTLGFGGLLLDESGFLNARFRWLDTGISRWISRDPIGEAGGLNLYEYAASAPNQFIDPTGLTPETVLFNPPLESEHSRQKRCARNALRTAYRNMRSANTAGSDKYFHCMGACEASKCGPIGKEHARSLLRLREDWGVWKGERDGHEDWIANEQGLNADCDVPCKEACMTRRPYYLDDKY